MSEPPFGGRVKTAAWLPVASRVPTTPAASRIPVAAQLEPQPPRIAFRISPIPANLLARSGPTTIVTCIGHASDTENNSRFLRQGHAHRRTGPDRHAPGSCERRHTPCGPDSRDGGLSGSRGPGGPLLPRANSTDGGHVRTAWPRLRVFHLWLLALPEHRDGGAGGAARRVAAGVGTRGRNRGQDLGTGPALPGDGHRQDVEWSGPPWRCAVAGEAD